MVTDIEVLRQIVQKLEVRVRALEKAKIAFIPGSATDAETGQLYVDAADSKRIKQK